MRRVEDRVRGEGYLLPEISRTKSMKLPVRPEGSCTDTATTATRYPQTLSYRVTRHRSVSEHSLRRASDAPFRRGHLVRPTQASGRGSPQLPPPGFRIRSRSHGGRVLVAVVVGREGPGWVRR